MKITKKHLVKIIKEQVSRINESKVVDAQKGDSVWRVMERDNPQLGTYYVFELYKIRSSNSNSISLENDNHIYNKSDGTMKGKSQSAYGSASYEIMSHDDAKSYYKELKDSGERVRGFVDNEI